MQRRTLQLLGTLSLAVALILCARLLYDARATAAREADEGAFALLTTYASAQEFHRLSGGRFGSVDELLAGGFLAPAEFADQCGADRGGLELSFETSPDGLHFTGRARPVWWLWGSASCWYIDESRALTSNATQPAGPDDSVHSRTSLVICPPPRPN